MSHRDPIDALHSVVLVVPGGITALARHLGRSPAVMHNKFSDAVMHNELTAREAIAAADWAKTTIYAEAICEHFGGVFVPLPAGLPAEDDVLQSFLSTIQQMGKLADEFTEARADGVVEPAEFQALKLRGHRTIAAVLHMLSEIETTVRELPTISPLTIKKVVG